MFLLLGYNMEAYGCLYIIVWTCKLVPVLFFFFKGEGRETLDTVFAKQSLRFLEQREKEDIVKSLGKPGFKVHTMCM